MRIDDVVLAGNCAEPSESLDIFVSRREEESSGPAKTLEEKERFRKGIGIDIFVRACRVCTLQENLALVVEETSDKSGCSGHASNFKLQTTPFSYLNARGLVLLRY